MPHAHHFLERLDRVKRAHTEFALELYRDHEAVHYVLDRVNLPDGAERVALAIGDTREGPFVIVTRNGRFVTCLGEGMSPGAWPVVPRAQIDALLARVHEMRSRRELAQRELRPHEDEENLFQRIVSRGSRLTREEFLAVSGFEAMLGSSPFIMMLDFSSDVLAEREGAINASKAKRLPPAIEKGLERHDRLTWAVAHLALLSGAGDKRELETVLRASGGQETTPTFSVSAQAGCTFLLRSAWLAGRLGKGVLPLYRSVLESGRDIITLMDAAMGIGAIGLRHASLFDDARRILKAQHAPAEANPRSIELIGRAAFAHWVGEVMDAADENYETAIRCGRDMCVTLSQNLPEGHALRYDKPEDVPEQLAKTAVLSFDADANNTTVQSLIFGALPLVARSAAEDFYFPREVIRAWMGAWSLDETLYRVSRFAELRDKRRKDPAVAVPKPGRNDPCTCGSGKKWKRCCGSGTGKAPEPAD